MENVEQLLVDLIAEVRALKEKVDTGLPAVLNKKRAARELDISVSKLKGMIQRGQISTCAVGDTTGISRSEIQRIAKSTPPRRRPGRPAKKPEQSTGESYRDRLKRH
jgi:hypothetical protein